MDYTKMRVDDFFVASSVREIAAECGICVKDVTKNEICGYCGNRGIQTFIRDCAEYIIEEIEYKRQDNPHDMVFNLIISAPNDQRSD